MKPILWLGVRWLKRLGLAGQLGIVLLLLAISGYVGMVLPERAKSEQLQLDVAQELAQQDSARLKPMEDKRTTESRLHVFYEFFPEQQRAPQLLKTLYRAAHDESITLSEGEYKFTPAKAGGIGRYQVDLPVRGSYVQIRRFIVKVLNSLPSAALDEVSFKREVVGSMELEASVRFTLYLRAD